MSYKHVVAALGLVFISNANSMEIIKHKDGDVFPQGREKTERAFEFMHRGNFMRAKRQLLEIKQGAPLVIKSEDELNGIDVLPYSIFESTEQQLEIEQLELDGLDIDDECKRKLLNIITVKLPRLRQIHLRNCKRQEDNPFDQLFYKEFETVQTQCLILHVICLVNGLWGRSPPPFSVAPGYLPGASEMRLYSGGAKVYGQND